MALVRQTHSCIDSVLNAMAQNSEISTPSVLVLATDDAGSGEARQAFLHLSMARHAGAVCKAAGTEGSWFARQCRASGVDFIPVVPQLGGSGGRILSKALKHHRFDVLHGFGTTGIALAVRHGRGLDRRSIASVYQNDQIKSARKAHRIFAADSQCQTACMAAGIAEEHVVLHGMAAPNQSHLGKHNRKTARAALRLTDEQIALFVPGPLHSDLGQDTVLDAVDSLGDERLRLIMPGARDSEFARAMHLQAAQMSSAAGGMIGRLADPSLMQAFDLCLAPIREAHAAHHVLSSMGAALPIIGNPVGLLADLVSDGEQGMLTQRSTAAGLAKALSRALADTSEFDRMGTSAAAHFRAKCSMRRASRRYTAQLRDLAASEAVT